MKYKNFLWTLIVAFTLVGCNNYCISGYVRYATEYKLHLQNDYEVCSDMLLDSCQNPWVELDSMLTQEARRLTAEGFKVEKIKIHNKTLPMYRIEAEKRQAEYWEWLSDSTSRKSLLD